MMPTVDQVLPSLESLGLWSYWIIGLATVLEAFFATGVFVPGTLIVDVGGVLVQQGALDFFDLVWFVALGSFLGSWASYWVGLRSRRMLRDGRPDLAQGAALRRADALFARYGGAALVIGRFGGPVSGLVAFSAGLAGMRRRSFLIWNAVGGLAYALGHVGLGYVFGDAFSRLGPFATRAALFLAAVLALVAVLWWMVVRIRRMMPLVLSLARTGFEAIAARPEVRGWAERHPRTVAILTARLDRSRSSGLTATLLAAAFLYILGVWIGSVFDLLLSDPIVTVDTRIANLIHSFREPGLLRVFTHVTALGDWRVVMPIAAAALIVLVLLTTRRDLAAGLTLALAGEALSVPILKAVFDRPRPPMAWFVESSGSFPSGHAAISVAFYGMLCFAAWRMRLLGPLWAALLAATLAFAIGLSRLYLNEHYLTDVLNGWLLGGLWLVAGIAVAVAWRESRSTPPRAPLRSRPVRAAAMALCIGLAAAAVWTVATYDKARAIPATPQPDRVTGSIADLLSTGALPRNSEAVTGTPLEPINVIILARDAAVLSAAMQAAGWARADRPGFSALAHAAWAAWTGQADGVAPVTPYFWNRRPNDFAFEKPTPERILRIRHHVRFWRTGFTDPSGLRYFVGAASFDNGFGWGFLHRIDPDIDAEREALASDLAAALGAVTIARQRLSPPRLGESVAGDPWFTDGQAIILALP